MRIYNLNQIKLKNKLKLMKNYNKIHYKIFKYKLKYFINQKNLLDFILHSLNFALDFKVFTDLLVDSFIDFTSLLTL